MEKKNLRNLLIGASAIVGIFVSNQSATAVKCYQILDALNRPVPLSNITKKTSFNDCNVSTSQSTSGYCRNSVQWYSEGELNGQLKKEKMDPLETDICTPTN